MEKSFLRKEYKQKRMDLSDQAKYHLDRGISNQIKNLIQKKNFKKVHVFLPIEKFNEYNSFLLLNDKGLSDVEFVIPVVSEKNMLTVSYVSENLRISSWGIPEPIDYIEVPSNDIDLVLVPMLVSDVKGNRIGYGKGFYDRFLIDLPDSVLKLGVSYFEPIKDGITADSWDVKLDGIIMENEILEF